MHRKRTTFGPLEDGVEDNDFDVEIIDLLPPGESEGAVQKSRGTTRRVFLTRNVIGGAALILGGIALTPTLISLLREQVFGQSNAADGSGSFQEQTIATVSWSPDGKQVVFVNRKFSLTGEPQNASVTFSDSVLIYQIEQGTGRSFVPQPPGKAANLISALAWAPGMRYIAFGYADGSIALWDTKSFSSVLTYQGSIGQVEAIAWSPDGQFIASGGLQESARICLSSNGAIVSKYAGSAASETRPLSWSPDSTRVVFNDDSPTTRTFLHVWDVQTGKTLFTFAGAPMLLASWSPDGRIIATVENDGKVSLWNAPNGAFIKSYTSSYSSSSSLLSPAALLWSPDSTYIALDSKGTSLQVWNVHDTASKLLPVHLDAARASIWLVDGRIALIDDTKSTQFIAVRNL